MKISIGELENKISDLLINAGMNVENSKRMTEAYMRASYRGVGHHDINDLASRVYRIKENSMNPNPEYTMISGFGAVQCYDGDNGPGELSSYFITEKSMEMAELYGIGYCTVCNSNHFLSAAPFAEMGEEKGFLTIVMSKSLGGLSLPGADSTIIGNNPFGFAAGYEGGKMLFDICCAYSSVGKIQSKIDNNLKVPDYWGNDRSGKPTADPEKVLESGLYMPIGEHKGFGIALLIELLTSVLGDGVILNQDIGNPELKGRHSQSAISINTKKIMGSGKYKDRVQSMTDGLRNIYPDIYIPGQRSVREKERIVEDGYFLIPDELFDKLNY